MKNNRYVLIVTDDDLKRIGDCFSVLHKKIKQPCSSGSERENSFDKILFGKKVLSHCHINVYPPNNRNEVHVEVSQEAK